MKKRKIKNRQKNGLTMIELLICVFIMTVITGILATSIIQARSLFQSEDVMSSLAVQAHYVMSRISHELRTTNIDQVNIDENKSVVNGSDDIKFKWPNFANNTPVIKDNIVDWDPAQNFIRFDPAKKDGLLLEHKGEKITLTKDATRIKFINNTASSREIMVVLELQKQDSRARTYNLTTACVIDMRN